MKRIAEAFRASMSALLGESADATVSSSEFKRTNVIRVEMLKCLGPEHSSLHPELHHQIEWAEDAESLWYLRSEMMTALAETVGEAEARMRMTDITELFLGIVKAAKASGRYGPPSLRRR